MEAKNLFERFESEFDTAGLKEALSNASMEEYRDVPVGAKYCVKIDKLNLTESKSGKPMVTCWMRILSGEYANSVLFMNQVVNTGYGMHMANEFLRTLCSGVDIKFESFKQYNNIIEEIFEATESYAYGVVYGEKKGFKTFKIVEVLEDMF